MKIVVLTVDHVYSNKLVKDILFRFGKDVQLIIEPKVLLKNKNLLQTIIHYVKVSGLIYFCNQFFKMIIYKIIGKFTLNEGNKFYNFNLISNNLNIKTIKVDDINSDCAVDDINKINPDLIISVLFPQIIKKRLINKFRNKIINFHPAYLPHYRGISPIFWSILNKENYVGYTIHYVNEGIDTGKILIRSKIKLLNSDTEDSAYQKSVNKGSQALLDLISDIKNKQKINSISVSGGNYFSFPDKKSVYKFIKNGHNFFKLRQFLWN